MSCTSASPHELPMSKLHYEDFVEGAVQTFGPRAMTREEIIAYAKEYDSQPMHLDEAAGIQHCDAIGGLEADFHTKPLWIIQP